MKNILVTGGAGFIGSNLVLELQSRFPQAWITILDGFRSANFKNLQDFNGDLIAADMAALDWKQQFGEPQWDAVFHLASITNTMEHDQRLQVHDNVEGFRKLLEFLKPRQTPLVFASSASTYGIATGVNRETDKRAPANVYAFSKMLLENLARHYTQNYPDWRMAGLRYFNVYGPREAHKGVMASMIYHLAQQMNANKRPRLFKFGEQKRDFVYVKDVVAMTIAALEAKSSFTILNAGTGTPRSFNDIVEILNNLLGKKLKPDYFDNPLAHHQPHTEADMSHTLRELDGFHLQFSLEDGIRDYLESGFLIEAKKAAPQAASKAKKKRA
ncbi:MAG: ADP-glyceromanno-heptose 6-epimerase [bacterium]